MCMNGLSRWMSDKGITNVEAQRIVQILQELSRNLTNASYIDQKFVEKMKNDEDNTKLPKRAELEALITDHLEKEEMFLDSINDTPLGEFIDEGHDAEQINYLHQNLHKICRLMAEMQEGINQAKAGFNIADSSNQKLTEFTKVLDQIVIETRNRLRNTVEADRLLQEQLDAVEAQLANRRERHKALCADREKLDQERSTQSTLRQSTLSRLNLELGDLNERTRLKLEVMMNDSKQRIADQEHMFSRKKQLLLDKIAKVKAENQALKDKTASTEKSLHAAKSIAEGDITKALSLYDTLMLNKHQQAQALTKEIETSHVELQKLNVRLEKVRAETKRKQQEKQLEEERTFLVEGKKKARDQMASLLQGWWRGVQERQGNFKNLIKNYKKANKKKKKKKVAN